MKSFWPLIVLGIFLKCSRPQGYSFEKIEYASFDVNSYRTNIKDSAYVDLYWSLSKKGVMKVYNNDTYHDTVMYYSFQLGEEEMEKIKPAFEREMKLKSILGDTSRSEGQIFGGSYDFFRVSYEDGSVDSICIIAPFMTTDFEKTYNYLDNIVFEKNERKPIGKFEVPSTFEHSLRSCFLDTKYLPPIKTLAPFWKLK